MRSDNNLLLAGKNQTRESALEVGVKKHVWFVENDHITFALPPQMKQHLHPNLYTVARPPDLPLVAGIRLLVKEVKDVVLAVKIVDEV